MCDFYLWFCQHPADSSVLVVAFLDVLLNTKTLLIISDGSAHDSAIPVFVGVQFHPTLRGTPG